MTPAALHGRADARKGAWKQTWTAPLSTASHRGPRRPPPAQPPHWRPRAADVEPHETSPGRSCGEPLQLCWPLRWRRRPGAGRPAIPGRRCGWVRGGGRWHPVRWVAGWPNRRPPRPSVWLCVQGTICATGVAACTARPCGGQQCVSQPRRSWLAVAFARRLSRCRAVIALDSTAPSLLLTRCPPRQLRPRQRELLVWPAPGFAPG